MIFSKLNSRTLIGLSAALALAGCSQGDDAAPAAGPAAIPVAVLEAQFVESYAQTQSLTGRVEATRTSATGFELAGHLETVLVDEGQQVAAGAELARLDTDRLRARRSEATAMVDQASVQLELASSTLKRMQEALAFQGVSQQEVDEARNQADSARAALAANRSRLESIDVDLDKSILFAPFDAQITQRHVDEGQVLQPGQTVLTLQEQGALTVRIGVAGSALSSLSEGSSHDLKIGDQTVTATVRQQLPQRNDVSRTVDVLLDLPESQSLIRSGDLARLTLRQFINERGLWLPVDALAEGQRGLWTVYVAVPATSNAVGATHKVEPRPVELIYQDTDRAFVRGALSEGDNVIRAGLQRVVPGQFVRLADETQT